MSIIIDYNVFITAKVNRIKTNVLSKITTLIESYNNYFIFPILLSIYSKLY